MCTERDKAGAIQAFEFCYELAWKTMKRALKLRGMETGSPKDTFRKAGLEQIISDPEVWFEFQLKRNLSLHTYEQNNRDEIIASFDKFSCELRDLINNINNLD